MREFLTGNWHIIFIVAVALAGLVAYLVKAKIWTKLADMKVEQFREIAYKLMKWAEKAVTGTKVGQDRFNQILELIYNLIPAWLKLFISKTYMEEKLEEWYNLIKDELDDGKINSSTNK